MWKKVGKKFVKEMVPGIFLAGVLLAGISDLHAESGFYSGVFGQGSKVKAEKTCNVCEILKKRKISGLQKVPQAISYSPAYQNKVFASKLPKKRGAKKGRKEAGSNVLSGEFPFNASAEGGAFPLSKIGVYVVHPEVVTPVKLSSIEINRIVCSDIQPGDGDQVKVIYPQGKGLIVKTSGKNIFVQFQIKKVGDKIFTVKVPSEIYITCGEDVYSLIAIPQRIPAVTVYLKNPERKIQKEIQRAQATPYEERIIEIITSIFKDKPLPEAEKVPVRRDYSIYPFLKITEFVDYVFEGEGFIARVFKISLKRNTEKDYADISEKDFLRKEFTRSPVAIALNRLRVSPGNPVYLVILEKTGSPEAKKFIRIGGE